MKISKLDHALEGMMKICKPHFIKNEKITSNGMNGYAYFGYDKTNGPHFLSNLIKTFKKSFNCSFGFSLTAHF
jgi:hypothetical protein